MKDVDFEKVLVSNRFLLVRKTRNTHNDQKVKSLHIMLPKSDASAKSYYGRTKSLNFKKKKEKKKEKYNTIWDKVRTD